MSGFVANDDLLCLGDAETLVGEIDRLRAEVTRLETLVSELDRLAHSDPLVGIPNRRGFLASLERLIARVERCGEQAAMLFIDVDGLKRINDQFGHEAGDAALIEVARMIVTSVRKSDCVGRLGGDEFGVLLERADELSAWLMALRVVETVVGSKFCLGSNCLPLSVAVGVGMIKPGDSPLLVMTRADEEMYRLK